MLDPPTISPVKWNFLKCLFLFFLLESYLHMITTSETGYK